MSFFFQTEVNKQLGKKVSPVTIFAQHPSPRNSEERQNSANLTTVVAKWLQCLATEHILAALNPSCGGFTLLEARICCTSTGSQS